MFLALFRGSSPNFHIWYVSKLCWNMYTGRSLRTRLSCSYWLLYKPISFYDVLTGCECTVTCLPLPPQLTMLQCRSHPTSRVRTLHVVVVLLLCNSIPCLADEHTHTVSGPTLREWRVAFSSMHIAIAIVHANFQLCDNTFVASAPCRLFNTCCDPAVCSVSSCPYRKGGLFLIQICNSLRG